MSERSPQNRLDEIGRTLRHAQATRRTETDSWLNGYQDDVSWLLEQLEALDDAIRDMLDVAVGHTTAKTPDDRLRTILTVGNKALESGGGGAPGARYHRDPPPEPSNPASRPLA